MSLLKDIIKGLTSNKLINAFREFSNSVFGYDPNQLVEVDSTNRLKTELALVINGNSSNEEKGKLTTAQAAELMYAYNIAEKNGENLEEKIKKSVTVLPTEMFGHRADSTVLKAEERVYVPKANELENNPRAKGGKERDIRTK